MLNKIKDTKKPQGFFIAEDLDPAFFVRRPQISKNKLTRYDLQQRISVLNAPFVSPPGLGL